MGILGDIFQGGLGGAVTGFGMGGIPGALAGFAGGGLLGGLQGDQPGVDDVLPSLNANELAQQVIGELPSISQGLGNVASQAKQGAQSAEQRLIASGVDPASAARIASSRGLSERKAGTESVISNRQNLEANLVGQLLPAQMQRDEDRQSYMNLQRDQSNPFEQFLPLAASAFAAPGSPGTAFLSNMFGGGTPNGAPGFQPAGSSMQGLGGGGQDAYSLLRSLGHGFNN